MPVLFPGLPLLSPTVDFPIFSPEISTNNQKTIFPKRAIDIPWVEG